MDTMIVLFLMAVGCGLASAVVNEFGNVIGSFPEGSDHNVQGTIYGIDDTTIWVRGFSYDGMAPDTFFYAGTSDAPIDGQDIIPDEAGTTTKLGSYENENLILNLPVGSTINSYKWIAIWCRTAGADFGHIDIPTNYEAPATVNLGKLGFDPRVHNTFATDVIILNTRQFKFVNLDYDGAGPGAYFWVDNGSDPTVDGTRIPHPYNSQSPGILPRFDGQTVIVTLPSDMTVFDFGNIGIWCEIADANFGHVTLPAKNSLNVPPYTGDQPLMMLENCQVMLQDKFQVAWTLKEAENKIVMQFIGLVEANEYMAFGISGSDTMTVMIGSDVTVAWIDGNNMPKAIDYYLNDKSQCQINKGIGACPDILQNGTEDVVLMGAIVRNRITRITMERPINTTDDADKDIITVGDVPISWAIGSINGQGTVAKHEVGFRASGTVLVNFGANPATCPIFEAPAEVPNKVTPWVIDPLIADPDTIITAYIGPSGGLKGYQGIAEQVGWGFAWYLNGELIPELQVTRGNTYTFYVYGGRDSATAGAYHPFYITNSMNGGYLQKNDIAKEDEIIYAQAVEGTYCEYVTDVDPLNFDTFEEYKQTLTLQCPTDATPGVLKWTVADDTPDVVYYQCYQHRYFGWKIIVSGAPASVQLSLLLLVIPFLSLFDLY